MSSTLQPTALDPGKLHQAMQTLDAIHQGDLSGRLDPTLGGEALAPLVKRVNDVIAVLDSRTEELHASSMDLALGLSDCFEALSQFRSGSLGARVSLETLGSRDELLAKLGAVVNETLTELERVVERQRLAIQTLSTPILQLWDGVLALPVIGIVDTARSAHIMEKLLSTIVERQARFVIVDITGVEVVDTKTADHFIKLMQAAQLLGARCFLTGIQPAVAQTLIDLGIDLSALSTLRNMQDGLRECLRAVGNEQQLVSDSPRR